jgi:hypothetical protein
VYFTKLVPERRASPKTYYNSFLRTSSRLKPGTESSVWPIQELGEAIGRALPREGSGVDLVEVAREASDLGGIGGAHEREFFNAPALAGRRGGGGDGGGEERGRLREEDGLVEIGVVDLVAAEEFGPVDGDLVAGRGRGGVGGAEDAHAGEVSVEAGRGGRGCVGRAARELTRAATDLEAVERAQIVAEGAERAR